MKKSTANMVIGEYIFIYKTVIKEETGQEEGAILIKNKYKWRSLISKL